MRVLVKLQRNAPKSHTLAELDRMGFSYVQELEPLQIHVMEYKGEDFDAAVQRARQYGFVQYVEKDKIHAETSTNDPAAPNAWHLTRIRAPEAWAIFKGAGAVVAVLDSGVDGDHPDLINKMVPGRCVVTDTADTSAVRAHGTQVSGILAAQPDNAEGIAGVGWDVKIMPIRVNNQPELSGAPTTEIIKGILWAADHGANVVNLSYALAGDPSFTEAIEYFRAKRGVVVWGMPNITIETSAPRIPGPIVVSGTDSSNKVYWSYGPALDIVAPAISLVTTDSPTGYTNLSGNSFAVPQVSAVCAMILALRPDLGPADVKAILFQSANDTINSQWTPGWDKYKGHGLLDAGAAMALAQTWVPLGWRKPNALISYPTAGESFDQGDTVTVTVLAGDDVGVESLTLYVNDVASGTKTAPPYTFPVTLSDSGVVTLRAEATDQNGAISKNTPVDVVVIPTEIFTASPEYLQENLSPGSYDLQAAAENSAGVGPYSGWVTVVVPNRVPAKLQEVIVLSETSTTALLAFTPSGVASSHEYRVDGGTPQTVLSNPFQITKALGDLLIDIRGTNTEGDGPWSNEVTVPALASAVASAVDLEAASEVTSPAIGQVHELAANGVESQAEVSSPSIGQVHELIGVGLDSETSVSDPALSSIHALSAVSIESESSVTSPDLGQVHTLVPVSLYSESNVSTPAIGQKQNLDAQDVSSDSSVTTTSLGQTHVVAASDIESESSVSVPAIGQIGYIGTESVASDSVVTSPLFGQVHVLVPVSLDLLSYVSVPYAAQDNNFSAYNVAADTNVTIPGLSQTHILSAESLQSDSSASVPVIGQQGSLIAENLYSSSDVTDPDFGQVHLLSAVNIESASETDTVPVSVQSSESLIAYNIELASEVGSSGISQVHSLSAEGLYSTAQVDSVPIEQVHGLVASSLKSTSTISVPDFGYLYVLVAGSVDSESTVSSSLLGVIENLAPVGVAATGYVSDAHISQVHMLIGKSIESESAVYGGFLGSSNTLYSDSIESSSSVTTPELSQNHFINAKNVYSESVVSDSLFNQTHKLIAVDISSLTEVGFSDTVHPGWKVDLQVHLSISKSMNVDLEISRKTVHNLYKSQRVSSTLTMD